MLCVEVVHTNYATVLVEFGLESMILDDLMLHHTHVDDAKKMVIGKYIANIVFALAPQLGVSLREGLLLVQLYHCALWNS